MREFVQRYLVQHAAYADPCISAGVKEDLGLVIVIPVCGENGVVHVLQSLSECQKPVCSCEVILVINHSEDAGQEIKDINGKARDEILHWAQINGSQLQVHVLWLPDLPGKKAGVGFARKAGMDEAVRRFAASGNYAGNIVCLDADCTVEPNYLSELYRFFEERPLIEGCSIRFSHPVQGLTPTHAQAILDYEQHLRYFIGMQRWAGLPYAFQTIGSAMAIRADAYCKVGGMNTRKAGEDFYFLHKVIQRGNFAELNSTTVYPSARISDRVPFGTGRAMLGALHHGVEITTYSPQSFEALRDFIQIVPELYQPQKDIYIFLTSRGISGCLIAFLQKNTFQQKLEELRMHTASPGAFLKRFFHWFDAFLLMKYVHWMRDEGGKENPDDVDYTNVPITTIAPWLSRLENAEQSAAENYPSTSLSPRNG